MECEAEVQTGNLRLLCPLEFELGKLYEIVGNRAVFMGGGFVVAPLGNG